jgi:uncharacterized protein (DUF58 family)
VTLLDPLFLSRLETLQLTSRSRLIGRFGGEHTSKRYGHTVDFADFREYQPGDDFRRIDYHVLARLDQVLIKLYEAEDEITVRLLIDTSASMAVEGKLDQARRIAAALGFVALTAHDAVTVHTFPAAGPPPRFSGRGSVGALFSMLEALEPAGLTPFAQAAAHLLGRPGPPGLTIVISDLLTADWSSLTRLRSLGSDLIVVHVLAAEDVDPDFVGDVELVDREDGDRLTISLTADVADSYRSRVEAWRHDVEASTIGVGGTYLPVFTGDDIEALLLTAWRRAGVLR